MGYSAVTPTMTTNSLGQGSSAHLALGREPRVNSLTQKEAGKRYFQTGPGAQKDKAAEGRGQLRDCDAPEGTMTGAAPS